MEIHQATHDDIPGILAVQNANLYSHLDPAGDLSSRGFLVYPVAEGELAAVVDDPQRHILFVAREGRKVMGYALGYDLDTWEAHKPGWESCVRSDNGSAGDWSQSTLYLRHIARLPEEEAASAPLPLVRSFIAETQRRKVSYLLGEILEQPVANTRSVKFSTKAMGLSRIGQVEYPEDQTVWGLYERTFNPPPSR